MAKQKKWPQGYPNGIRLSGQAVFHQKIELLGQLKKCHIGPNAGRDLGIVCCIERSTLNLMNRLKKLTAMIVAVAMAASAVPAFALDGQEVEYLRGSVNAVKEGTIGRLDSSSAADLVFHSDAGQFAIPYAAISSFKYHSENKFRLGVLATIAVGLLKAREKRYMVTITWKDPAAAEPEVATVESSRSAADGLIELLRARASQGCKVAKTGEIDPACGKDQWER